MLEQPPEEAWSKRHKYAAWFDKNAGKYFHFLTGDDCYSLRGGVRHHGKFGHPQSRYDHLGFTTPDYPIRINEGLSENNGGIEESMLTLDVEMFCQRLIQAVREWFMANVDTPNVQQNLPNVVRLRPQGVAPHFVGMPIIA